MKKSFVLFCISLIFAVLSFALDIPDNKLVDVAWLKQNINDKSIVLIMVDKSGKTYDKEHIPGTDKWTGDDIKQKMYKDVSVYLPSPLQFTRLAQKSGISTDSLVVFYGSGVDFKEEARALEGLVIAEYYGIENSVMLDGGLAAWKKAGNEVTKEIPRHKNGNFKITKMNDVIATLLDVDAAVELKNSNIIDARPAKYYRGKDTDKRLKKHGKIDGAISIQTQSFYKVTDGVAQLKEISELKKIFKDAGVDLNKPIISYCNTGHLTSGVWYVSKYILGAKNVKNYKASMVEYTAMPQRKVIKD